MTNVQAKLIATAVLLSHSSTIQFEYGERRFAQPSEADIEAARDLVCLLCEGFEDSESELDVEYAADAIFELLALPTSPAKTAALVENYLSEYPQRKRWDEETFRFRVSRRVAELAGMMEEQGPRQTVTTQSPGDAT